MMTKTKLTWQLISKLDAIHLVKNVVFWSNWQYTIYNFDSYYLEDKEGNRVNDIETLKTLSFVYLYN